MIPLARHRRTAVLRSTTTAVALALSLTGTAAQALPSTAFHPAHPAQARAGSITAPRAAAASPKALPDSGKLPYYGDKLMKELLMIRYAMEKGQPHRAFNELANVAFTLADPTGLSEEQLDDLVSRPPQGVGPLVVFRKVDLFAFRDYLPADAYDRIRKAGLDHVLMIGGMSFPGSAKAHDEGDPKGLHSEPLVLRALNRLATDPAYKGASFAQLTWASDRDYCEECQKVVDGGARRFYAYDYGLTPAEIAERDKKIAAVQSKTYAKPDGQQKAIKRIEIKYEKIARARNAQARVELGTGITQARKQYAQELEDEKKYENATSDVLNVPSAPCPTTKANGATWKGGSPAVAAAPAVFTGAGLRRAGPCDEGGATRGSSGLAKALADPSAAPGGIDFTTLELRYLSDSGRGLRYAFNAGPGKPGGKADAEAGVKAAKESSDAFFVWLSMPRSTFWVNLNPTEPDRIVNPLLGGTDVGRVLLQADLQLKKTTASLIHPKTSRGKEFWKRIGKDCLSFRTWIVPGEAHVNDDQDQLYILDAPLKVKMESQRLSGPGSTGAASCKGGGDPTAEARNEATFRQLILPGIERAVNQAPEYADLRRAYLARVAAEWYRQRDAHRPTTYGDLIDRADVSRWRTRTAWKPRDTFDAYVRSFKQGEFKYTEKTRKGDYLYTQTYIYGGVDLSRLDLRTVAPAQAFRGRWTDMRQDTARSARAALTSGNGSQVWMGGDHSASAEGTPGQGAAASGGKGGGNGDRGLLQTALEESGGLARRLVAAVIGAGLLYGVVLLRRRTARRRPRP
ncbi:hypothetical protein ABT160_44220 [Streptomyces sp. NPDC001941]|uniref:hypothetical protein n=1 Tax=Streptomyces sp. NPDC001941 TaxID=3154659 RepID=UPI00332018C7